jgi:hypothetical protein
VTVTSASARGALGRMHSARNDSLQVVRDTPRFAGKHLPLGHAFRWAGLTDANRSGIDAYNARRTALSVPKCAKQPPTFGGSQRWSLSTDHQRQIAMPLAASGGRNSRSNDGFYHSLSLTMTSEKRNRLKPRYKPLNAELTAFLTATGAQSLPEWQ